MNRIALLRQLIGARYGGNVAAFSRAIGKSPSQVHQWLSGHRMFGDAGARNVELTLKLPMGYFDKTPEEAEKLLQLPATQATLVVHPDPLPPNLSPGPDLQQVPLISWVHAGDASEAIDNYPPGWAEDWIDVPRNVPPRSYALRIVGDSMTPEFWPGQTIVIDPEAEWRNGSYVIVKNGDNEVVLRQIVRELGGWVLVPANKAYLPQPLGSYHVIGVVRWSQKQYP